MITNVYAEQSDSIFYLNAPSFALIRTMVKLTYVLMLRCHHVCGPRLEKQAEQFRLARENLLGVQIQHTRYDILTYMWKLPPCIRLHPSLPPAPPSLRLTSLPPLPLLLVRVRVCSPRYSCADVTKALQQVRPCLGEVVPQEKYVHTHPF
jgi:hypothetical protein